MNKENTKVYGKLKNDLEKMEYDEPSKYVKLVEDFSELMKRIECTFEALSFRFTLDSMILFNDKPNFNLDHIRNLNWIYLSYSCTEFTNLFYGEVSFPRLYEKLFNSLSGNKFPAYLGITINEDAVRKNELNFIAIQEEYKSDINDIKNSRDKSFSHVDKNQDIDLPSTQIMIRIINRLNNIFIELFNLFEIKALKIKDYTSASNPEKFSGNKIIEKIEFLLLYVFKNHPSPVTLVKGIIKTIKPKIEELLS